MKKRIVFMFIVLFVPAYSLAQNPKIYTTKLASVSELKRINFPYKPIKINTSTQETSTKAETTSLTNSSAGYSVGNGVLLSPINSIDAGTGSYVYIKNVVLDQETISNIKQDNLDMPVLLQIKQGKPDSYAILFHGSFRNLPRNMHTYILTIKMVGPFIKERLAIHIGDSIFKENDFVINKNTDEIRILFNYENLSDAQKSLPIHSRWKDNNPIESNVRLYYIQLTQLD